jgi:hypothetical protein
MGWRNRDGQAGESVLTRARLTAQKLALQKVSGLWDHHGMLSCRICLQQLTVCLEHPQQYPQQHQEIRVFTPPLTPQETHSTT